MFQLAARRFGASVRVAQPTLQSQGPLCPFGLRTATSLRDPERPSRPISPYLRFLADFRQRETTKKMKPTEVMKAAGNEWKTLPESTKQPYEKPYEQEMQKYREAFDAYEKSGKLAAWKRDPEKPKKPLTGFMRYSMEVRPQYEHLKATEQMKEIASKWKAMTPSQKEPYEKAASAENQKYQADMKSYKESGKEAAWRAKKGLDKLDEKKMKAKLKLAEAESKAKAKDKAAKAKAVAAYNKAKLKLKKMKDRLKAAEKKAKEMVKVAAAKEKEAQKLVKSTQKAVEQTKSSPKAKAKAKATSKAKAKAKA